MEIFHPSHSHHALKLMPPAEPFKCNACKELGLGPCYACKVDPNCKICLHEECAPLHGNPPPVMHPFFSGCTFLFHMESSNRVCDACGRDVLGISYRCTHPNSKTAHDVHPCCLKLPSYMVGEGGVHLYLASEVSSKCGKCGKREAASKVKGWSYVSGCGKYCYHVACVKDMVLEKYQGGYLDRHMINRSVADSSCQLAHPNSASALSRTSNEGSIFGKKTKMVLKIATVVLKLIISAIFGNPTAGVAILIESLFTKT